MIDFLHVWTLEERKFQPFVPLIFVGTRKCTFWSLLDRPDAHKGVVCIPIKTGEGGK